MDIKNLFDGLAKYLDFLLDLFQLKGIEKYAKPGEISGDLVAFFVAGLLIAYLVSAVKRVPGYEPLLRAQAVTTDAQKPSISKSQKPEDPVNKPDMAQFAIMSILGALLLHGFLLLYSQVVGAPKIGSVKETLNAVFAFNALYHPFNAFALQVQRGAKALVGTTKTASIVAAIVMLLVALSYFATLVYLLYPLAALHGTTIAQMLWLCVAFIISFFGVLFAFFLALGISPKTLLSRSRDAA